MVEKKEAGSFIYFAYLPFLKIVKIGVSKNPAKRIKQATAFLPFEGLYLLGQIPGDTTAEKELHKKYKSYCYRNEWFFVCGHLKQWIEKKFGRVPAATTVSPSGKKMAWRPPWI